MPEPTRSETLLSGMRWLGGLRWITAVGLAGVALFFHFVLRLQVAWQPLLVLAVALAVYNGLLMVALSYLGTWAGPGLTARKAERLACLQIAADLVVLTLCLHFSGGAENPLVMVYVLPPIIASVLLSSGSAYLIASWATVLFVTMAVCHAVWPSLYHSVGRHQPMSLFRDPVYLAGEAATLAVTVYLSVYLANSVATRLRRHEQELARAGEVLQAKTNQLTATNRELQELEERKSRFLGLAAHQLRGPLAAIEGYLACVCDGYETDPAKQAEFLRRARVRIQGMLEIVRDLLTLAGTHSLTTSTKWTRVRLDELAGNVVEQNRDFASSRQVEIVFHPGAPYAEVLGDERALASALGNLVSNAIKYSGDDGHVKVTTRATDREAVCEVIDDGIGIPEAEKEDLFSDFFRASNARSSGLEGTGLGLSIVKGIIDRLGGLLKIESLENLGTCAVMELPLARPESVADSGDKRGSA